MKKYEYKIQHLKSHDNEQETTLNDFGEEGWELIHVHHYADMIKYTLKRVKNNIL